MFFFIGWADRAISVAAVPSTATSARAPRPQANLLQDAFMIALPWESRNTPRTNQTYIKRRQRKERRAVVFARGHAWRAAPGISVLRAGRAPRHAASHGHIRRCRLDRAARCRRRMACGRPQGRA